jgi:hypothetical protein
MSISTIVYNNQLEWTCVRDDLYETIKNSIIKCVVDDKYEYDQMIALGFTEKQRIYLMDILEKEFFKISFNEEWVNDITFNIIYGIQGFFQGLIKTNKWVYIYKSLEPIELANILFENIKWQLDDDLHMPCLLENIPRYRCNKCNNIVEYLVNFNLCDNCDMQLK